MEHKIKDVEVFYVSTDEGAGVGDSTLKFDRASMVVVKVSTDQGLEGFGLAIWEEVAPLIQNRLKPVLMGQNPIYTEDLWQKMFTAIRGAGRKGLGLVGLSIVDLALWDLKGKILGLPIHKVLGSQKRLLPTYASGGWTSYDREQLLAEMKSFLDLGYTTVKMKVGVEGGKNIREDAARVRLVRDLVGYKVELMIDPYSVWVAASAVRFHEMTNDCGIAAFEEPVGADDIPGLARIRRSLNVPLATGEHEYTKHGLRDLLLDQAVDIVQIDGTKAGGLTEMIKIAAMSQAWNLIFAPHCFEMMHMHLISAVPNAFKLEKLFLFNGIMRRIFTNYPVPVKGILEIPDLPGHGLIYDMDWIRENNENR